MENGYVIYCDANTVAISGVLMQTGDKEGDEYVISYTRKKLKASVKNFPIIELELFSIVHSVKTFHQFIYMKPAEVRSDHRPLVYLNSLAKHSNRLMRWVGLLILQNYNLRVTYVPGKKRVRQNAVCYCT